MHEMSVDNATVLTTPRLLGSATKCLALLDALAAEPGPAGVSELARRTNTARGTTHQRLRTLVAAGWVEGVGDGKYRLTLRAVAVGNAVLEQADLGSRILSTLTSVAGRTGETSSIAVLDRAAAMIIQRVASDRELKADIKAGTRMPLDSSASGRVLIAFSPDREVDELRRSGVALPADQIIQEARHTGFASQHDGYFPGMSSIAVPIHPTKLGVIALAITAPTARYDQTAALHALEAGAREIALVLRG
jgi:DNA-binding IclR family transcriptional regulator